MTRMIAVTSITRSRGLPGVFRPLAVVLLLALCGVARALIDPDDPDHSPQEFFSRPSPPPPARDPDIYGGLYDGIVTWKNDSNPITVMCTVVIKEQLYVEPGAVIRVRPNCSDVGEKVGHEQPWRSRRAPIHHHPPRRLDPRRGHPRASHRLHEGRESLLRRGT